MWHFTDVFYHTDGDRLEMVSPKEMRNVGISALAAAFTLSSADEKTALLLIDELTKNALDRLETEYNLSKEAVLKNSSIEKEWHILKVWANWYQEAVGKMIDINTTGKTKAIEKSISHSRQLILLKADSLVSLLGEG